MSFTGFPTEIVLTIGNGWQDTSLFVIGSTIRLQEIVSMRESTNDTFTGPDYERWEDISYWSEDGTNVQNDSTNRIMICMVSSKEVWTDVSWSGTDYFKSLEIYFKPGLSGAYTASHIVGYFEIYQELQDGNLGSAMDYAFGDVEKLYDRFSLEYDLAELDTDVIDPGALGERDWCIPLIFATENAAETPKGLRAFSLVGSIGKFLGRSKLLNSLGTHESSKVILSLGEQGLFSAKITFSVHELFQILLQVGCSTTSVIKLKNAIASETGVQGRVKILNTFLIENNIQGLSKFKLVIE